MAETPIFLSTSQMTALFHITRQGLSRWVERGMPKASRNRYPLFKCLDWVKVNVWFVGVGTQNLAEEKLKYQRARTRREELRVAQEEGLLVPCEASIHWVSQLCVEAKALLIHWPYRLSGTLAAETDAKVIQQMLRKEVYDFLNIMYRGKEAHEKKPAKGSK